MSSRSKDQEDTNEEVVIVSSLTAKLPLVDMVKID